MASDSHCVLQVIQAPQRRGAEVFALQLSAALKGQSWTATLMSLYPGNGDETFAAGARGAGVWGGVVGSRREDRVLSWSLMRAVARRVEDGGFGIVQANGADTLKYLATARMVTRGRWRLVYRTIGMPSFWRRDPLRLAAYRWWFRQADMVVAVCRRAGEDLIASVGLPAPRVRVIPNGVDAQPFLHLAPGTRARVRAEAGAQSEDVVLVHVGSLSPEKNHRALIRAAGQLRQAGVPVRIWLIGGGAEQNAIEQMTRDAGVHDRTWFAGVRSDVAAVLAGADVLVLPSLTEGMPAVVIEAGLSGLPVVAYDVGGLDEVVQHGKTGLLVPSGDERALHGALSALAGDPARREAMGAAARVACAQYDIGLIAARYADVYAGLLNGAG